MKLLLPALLFISSLAFSQSDECSKYIKLLPNTDGYDPSGIILSDIKVPIDDTSGIIMSISGKAFASSITIKFYGVKPSIIDAVCDFSLTNHQTVKLYVKGGDGFALINFGKDGGVTGVASQLLMNRNLDLVEIGKSKLRGFRLSLGTTSIGFVFPPEKQDYLKNAINCILNL